MRRLLHVLTQPDDSLADEIITAQQMQSDLEVTVVDLSEREPDYPALLEAIFAADSITVW